MKIEVARQRLKDKKMNIFSGEPHQIGGIYVLGLEKYWDIQAQVDFTVNQVVSDLLSTENGTINNKFERVKSHISLEYFYNPGDRAME